MSVATRNAPSAVVTLIATSTTLDAAGAVVGRGERVAPYLLDADANHMNLAGIALAVGLLAYYYALSIGPISVVVPPSDVRRDEFGPRDRAARRAGYVRRTVGTVFAALAIYLIGVE